MALSTEGEPPPTRRAFLKGLGLMAVGAAFPQIVRAETLGRGGGTAANSRVQMGFIGMGGKGSRNLSDFAKNFPHVACVAACDVKQKARESAQRIAKLPDSALFTDLREMLAKVPLDAVTISTPDHWHVPAARLCIRKGCAVYIEKPMSLFIGEGQEFVDLADSLNAKVQVGSQQRSVYPAILRAVRAVRDGRIGDVHTVHVCLPKGAKDFPFEVEPVPPDIDYDLWLGPAPLKPYCTKRVSGLFRSILDYSNGMLADWGAHHFDIVQWALDMDRSGPSEVEGKGVFPKTGLFDAPTDYDLKFFYPKQKVTVYASPDFSPLAKVTGVIPDRGRSNAILFVGTQGWVYCERVKSLASSPAILDSAQDLEGKMDRDKHKTNFIEMITNGAQPYAPAVVGHRSASVCHLGMISLLLGAHLHWNPDKQVFEGESSDLANRHIWKSRRGDWHV
jgi:predicted dehydrogenase